MDEQAVTDWNAIAAEYQAKGRWTHEEFRHFIAEAIAAVWSNADAFWDWAVE